MPSGGTAQTVQPHPSQQLPYEPGPRQSLPIQLYPQGTPGITGTGLGRLDPDLAAQLAGVGGGASPAANQFSPAASQAYTIQGQREQQRTADQAAGSAGRYQPLLDPLALQLYYKQTIAPLLAGVQERAANHINTLFGNLSSDLQKWNLPEGIAGAYAANLPGLQVGYNRLNDALAAQVAAAPAFDAYLNKLNSMQNTVMKDYFERQGGQAGGTDILSQLGLTPPAAAPSK